jgi:hypothetical protein
MTEKTCEICSRTLPATARYCRRCGHTCAGAAVPSDKSPVAPLSAKSSPPARRSGGSSSGGGFWKILLFAGLVWARYHFSQPHPPPKFDPLKPIKAPALVPMPKLSLASPADLLAPPLAPTTTSTTPRVPSLAELDRVWKPDASARELPPTANRRTP